MADITLSTFSPSNGMPPISDRLGGKMAGATIQPGMLLAVRSDNMVYPFLTGTDTVPAGFAPGFANPGTAVSIYRGQRYGCSASAALTGGTYLYPAATTPGGVATSATGGAGPVMWVVTGNGTTNNIVQALV